MSDAKKEILILGGGFAGLAAAVELSSRGYPVTLLEARSHLGGRAYSYHEPMMSSVIDNGQHAMMGCYHHTFDFLNKIETLDKLTVQRRLSVPFAGDGIKRALFQSLRLPDPFHLLGAFFFFKGLSFVEKMAALKFGQKIKKMSPDDFQKLKGVSVRRWLENEKQPKRLQNRFWDPFVLATLNDVPEKSDAYLLAVVIKEALLSGKKNSRMVIPSVGLSDLYTEAAKDYIERNGGTIILKAKVLKIHFHGREFGEVELEGGRRMSADVLLSTIPFTGLRKILLEQILYHDPFFAGLLKMETSPIVSIHLWFDRPIFEERFIGLWGTKAHWIFNRKATLGDNRYYYTLVLSGAREELMTPGPRLIVDTLKELDAIFPEIRSAKLLHSSVTKEPEATLAPKPGVNSYRPNQRTPYHHFYLAGDWTNTGLPATIESAVKSAHLAVEAILEER